jgi:7-cyano-7-deazaguanine synthase in queuosine biosynthesis
MITSFSAKDQNFYTSVYIGSTKDDLNVPKLQERKRMKEEIFANTTSTIRNAFSNEFWIPEIKIVEPYWSKTIEELVELAPRELLEMTWSCRTPVDGEPCNQCFACKRRKRVGL